jgi:hypothetical protein
VFAVVHFHGFRCRQNGRVRADTSFFPDFSGATRGCPIRIRDGGVEWSVK